MPDGNPVDVWTPAAPFTVTASATPFDQVRIYIDGGYCRDECGTWEPGPHAVRVETLGGTSATLDVRLYCDGMQTDRREVVGASATLTWECP